MIEYILNGKIVKIKPEHEQYFLSKNPTAQKKSDVPGKSKEASQPQIKQAPSIVKKDMESKSEDGSSGSLKEFKLDGKVVRVQEKHVDYFKKNNPTAQSLDFKAGSFLDNWRKGFSDETVPDVPKDGGFFEDLVTSWQMGTKAGGSVNEAMDVYKLGADISQEQLAAYIRAAKEMESMEPTQEKILFDKVKNEAGGGIWGVVKGLAYNPGYFLQGITTSISTMVNSFADSEEVAGAALASAGAGAGGGAIIGSTGFSLGPLGVLSTGAGALTGAASGLVGGLVGAMETGLTLTDLLKMELQRKDIDPVEGFNEENIYAILEDADAVKRIRNGSLARGITVGAIEGLTIGLSRGTASMVSSATRSAAKATLAAGVTEMLGGSTGEFLGQKQVQNIYPEKEIDMGEVALEGIMEVKGTVNSADVIAKIRGKKYSINGREEGKSKVLDVIDTATPEEIAKMDIQIENDNIVDNLVKEKQRDAITETQIDPKVVGIEDRKKLVELQKRKLKAEEDVKKQGVFKVIGAERILENINEEINEIITPYEATDGRTSAVRQQKKAAADVVQTLRDRQQKAIDTKLEKTIEFAKQNAKFIDKDVIEADSDGNAQALHDMAVEEYNAKNPDNPIADVDVQGADGFIVGDVIVINKAVAGKTGQINVGAHELLHGVVSKQMTKLNDQQRTKLITDFNNTLTEDQRNYVQNIINARNAEGENIDINSSDEVLTVFSDGITKGDITFNEGVFSKLKNIIQEVLRKVGIKKEFADGRQVYNFMKDYQKTVSKGSEISRRAQRLSEGGQAAATAQSRTPGQTPLEAINDLIPDDITTRAKYESLMANEKEMLPISRALRQGGVINNYVRSRQTSVEEGNKMIDNVTMRLFNFNPEATRADGSVLGPEGFGEFLFANTRFAKLDAKKQLFEEGQRRARSIDDEGVPVQIADEPVADTFETADISRSKRKEIKTKGFVKEQRNFSSPVTKAIRDNIVETNYNLEVNNKFYEDVKKDLVAKEGKANTRSQVKPKGILYPILEAVANKHYGVDARTIIAAPQNLTDKESKKARRKIAEDFENMGVKQAIESIFPQFQYNTVTGKSVGINNAILKAMYDEGPGIRVPNIKGQVLNLTKLTDNDIRSLFGINADNTLMPFRSKMPWDGFIKGYITQASVVAANQEAREVSGQPDAQIGISKPETMFSRTPEILQIRNVFELEEKGINKLFESFGIKGVYDLKTEEGIKEFLEVVENKLLPLMPKDFWFGPGEGTVFTPSYYVVGTSSNTKTKNKYKDLYNNVFVPGIKALKNKPGVKFGPPISGIKDYSISSYKTIFRDNSTIEANIKNGKIKAWNEKVSTIHREMWRRFNKAIREDTKDKKTTRAIGNYLKMVGSDTKHWHKLGAQFVGYSEKVQGTRFEYEHAMPATAAYLYLLDAALSEFDFNSSYDLVVDNYKLIALDKAMDKKLIAAKLQRKMPAGWSVLDNWWQRYFNEQVAQQQGGIEPSSIKMVDGGNMAQALNIDRFGRTTNVKFAKNPTQIKRDIDIVKATQLSRSPQERGMSTFDFDDTLAKTKSGVRATVPNLDNQPKPNRKVIFLAGGAGSGKGNVVSKLNLSSMGFKIVNSDISLEWLKKNSGLPADMRDLTPAQRSILGKLGAQARQIARNKMMKYQGNASGVVVDGTGGSVRSMQKLVDEFKSKGYDVAMIFVDTSLDVALQRNRARQERSLLDSIVKRNHEAVQGNKEDFKKMFGERFMEVNTDELTQASPMPQELIDQVNDYVISYEKLRLDAEEFASQGDNILERGGTFDFSEFNKVVDGTPGPLLDKAKQRAAKFGTKDMFVLTARPQASAEAIQQFLKSQGLNIPLKNITGLANSTGDAKAQWMLNKFAEGYNNMYFVDDALQNVEAVRDVLNQLDIKSEVVQAKTKFSRSASSEFNKIIEESKGVKAERIISQQEALRMGRNKNWFRLFVPPSAEDFKGLLYRFLGTGRKGEQHMAWFKTNLLDPFAKGIREWNMYKQNISNDYKALKKQMPSVSKNLNKKVPGTEFTNDSAIRVYLWNKFNIDTPGIDEATRIKLVQHVASNIDLKNFADILSDITRLPQGYSTANQNWSLETIATDLNNIVNKVGRKQFLSEYLANVDAIFTPDNMNKIQGVYGIEFKEALDNVLYRMENGTNRVVSNDRNVNRFLGWINGSIGAIMFFNMRSALLQTISTVNFVNWSDNNVFKASAAFANQPQFWKDFAMLFNSPQLKQRRAGLQTDVSASELTNVFAEGGVTPFQKANAVIKYLLQIGFTPTQLADSFAISLGGATFYRNRFKTYKKQGLSDTEANQKAMLDFQEIAEETQQSSREDLISMQQASVLGRLILAFQNVTMQYTRLTKKALSDIINRRGDLKTNISKVLYYGMVQNLVFGALQSALVFILFGLDEEEEKEKKKIERVLNGALDSLLRGTGIYGAIASTIKNTVMRYQEERQRGWGRDDGRVIVEALQLSPPIGSKVRKIYNAIKTEQYNKGVSEEIGLRIENPNLVAASNVVEALTNVPTARIVKKANNVEEAITGQHALWQRVALFMGWSRWDIGVKDEELEEAKKDAKKTRDEIRKKEKERKKKEEEAKKPPRVRCTAIKKSGGRCKNQTRNTSKRCYAHQ